VGFDVLTTCQPSTVWCSRERLPAAAAQPAKVRQSCSATESSSFVSKDCTLHGYHPGIVQEAKGRSAVGHCTIKVRAFSVGQWVYYEHCSHLFIRRYRILVRLNNGKG
jgi:hypothetical protein